MIEFRTGVIRPIECYKEGWELIKDRYWLLLAVCMVGAIIGGASMYVLLGAMICGIYYCYFQKIDSGRVEFEGLFKGFNYFLPSLLVTLLIIVPTIFVIAMVYVPFIVAAMMGSRLSGDEMLALLGGALAVDLVFAVLMVCVHTLLMFAFPLIVDRQLTAVDAIKTSSRAVLKNMGGVVGLMLVGFALSILGYLALCIGLYFVIPVMFAANVVAFRKVFPKEGGGRTA